MGDSTLETGTEYLLARIEDGVAVLTMNRPERLNALHPEMFQGFARVLPSLAASCGSTSDTPLPPDGILSKSSQMRGIAPIEVVRRKTSPLFARRYNQKRRYVHTHGFIRNTNAIES